MHILSSLVAIMTCLLCVVGIHELGHAVAAKLCGVKIRRITLGLGRPLIRYSVNKTVSLDLCLWPLGGRVHLLNTQIEPVAIQDHPFCFNKKPIWMRIIILLAGSFANILVAIVALTLMMMLGFKQIPSIVNAVAVPSLAATAGIQPFDRITQVAGHPTYFWRDVSMQLIMHVGEEKVPITFCRRSGICKNSDLDLRIWQEKSLKPSTQSHYSIYKAIGIEPDLEPGNIVNVKGLSFWQACISAWSQLIGLIIFSIIMLKQIITSHLPFASLVGPFKLFQTIIDSFSEGLTIFLYFIANFSIAMGLANLLPIPGLDGGSILYGLIEKIRGKPISIAADILIYRLLSIAFTLIFIQLMVNDLRFYFE